MSTDHEEMFFNPKPVMALIAIRRTRNEEQNYIRQISQRIDTTNAHCNKLLSKLEDKGFVRSKKRGRKRLFELTDKGKEYAELFDSFDVFDMQVSGSVLA